MAFDNGDKVKAVAEFVLDDGTIVQNVYYFECDLSQSRGDSTILAGCRDYIEDIYAQVVAYMANNMTVNPIVVDKMEWDSVAEKWETVYNAGQIAPTITPGAIQDQLPNPNAAIMTGNTTYPKSRGRKFLPGWVDTSADGSELITAAATALAAAAAVYIAEATLVGDDVLVPGVLRTVAGTFAPFLSAVVTDIMGTQRRRRPGVGI